MSKRILITGVTGNIGKAACAYFKSQGWLVTGIAQRSRPDIEPDQFIRADLANDYPTLPTWSKFDVVLMAHGVASNVEFQNIASYWDRVIPVNLTSHAILTSGLCDFHHLADNALIVYCSSIHAQQPRRGRALYAIAKAGIEGLTKAAAVELAPQARTVCLRLGQMKEQMRGVTFTQKDIERIEGRTPLPWIDSQDVAHLCLSLYQQSSLTGSVIDLSSGHPFSVWPD